MNKGLEKLKTIRHIHDTECGKDKSIDKDFDIIEKELTEYQEIKTYMQQYGIENIEELRRVLHNDWVIRQKFKTDTAYISKALEIIIKKDVHITLIKSCENADQYNRGLLATMNKTTAKKYHLLDEQFNAVKEVLL